MAGKIEVFKFGGASVRDADGVRNVVSIVKNYKETPLVVVVSAMAKTTNALESLVKAHYYDRDRRYEIFEGIKNDHWRIMRELFDEDHPVFYEVNDAFVEIDWALEEEPHPDYDYTYDQIVPVGELISSIILSHALAYNGVSVKWQDARDVIRTDDAYRDARIDWVQTEMAIQQQVRPEVERGVRVVTQGFIGATSDNQSTTLGREGSDYTAAVFAYCLNASKLSIWKDVPGILTADPAQFENVDKLDRISFREAIEMTYYGAKVIHPKTIQPLQNKSIPLYVKSFIHPEGEGTLINAGFEDVYPPVIVLEKDQTLLHISTRDFSFIAVDHLAHIFGLFDKFRIKVNLMRNSAVSFSVCVQDHPARLPKLLEELEQDFNLVVDKDLELLTIRHYQEDQVRALTTGKVVVFEERFRETLQLVVRDAPLVALRK